MARLHMQWHRLRDEAGYSLEIPERRAPGKTRTILDDADEPGPQIVRKGTIDSYDPLAVDGLYNHLKDCADTPEGALKFVQKFGFLREGSRALFSDFSGEVRAIRSLVAARDRGDQEALALWFIDNRRAIRVEPSFDGGELFYRPRDLMSAVYLQFFQDTTDRVNLRKCRRPGCGEWFKYGPGTDHRDTAQYHSPKCKNAHSYLKLKGQAK